MSNIKTIVLQYLTNRVTGIYYVLLIESIILYNIGYLLSTSLHFAFQFCLLLMLLGLVGIVISFFKLIRIQINNQYLKIIFFCYILWSLVIIFQGFEMQMLIHYLYSPYLLLHYFVPFLILIPKNIFNVKILFNHFEFLSILLFIFFIIYYRELLYVNLDFSEQTVWTLGTGGGFLLLTWEYQNNRKRIIAFFSVILSLFISTVMARRNIMLTFSNYILISIIIFLFNSNQSFRNKLSLLTVIIISTILIYGLFFTYQDKLFNKISTRLNEDTRSFVVDAYMEDMSKKDWIIGKGFNGSYYCPGVVKDDDNRTIIENGYLQTILKGGLISLSLFLLILLPAIYLGLVKSRNILSKASGFIPLLWLIDMFVWGMPTFNIRYILLWLAIGICYSNEIRKLSDSEIKQSLTFSRT